MNLDMREFENPSNIYRGKPFWSWNGKLEKNELLRQIDIINEMGMGGFFMHSRTGLATEYLGDEWFDLINICADYGYSKGLETYLYDEDRWPSGTAGGKATQNPKYRAKFIEMVGDEFKIVEAPKDSFYNGNTYLDTLNKEATMEFIRVTHEKYKEKCGSRLGREIKGIFTDEPHRGSLFASLTMGYNFRVPYTDNLYELFYDHFGYRLEDNLKELFLTKETTQVKWHYCELLEYLFIENFMKPIYDWCEENNILLTGHALQEQSLSAQTGMQGSLMRSYEFMHMPGIDNLTEYWDTYWTVVQCRSVARQTGRRWVVSELYGCMGWQANFHTHKRVGDWQALFGINVRCHHLSWYTMAGTSKRDYPASILHQSGWYREYKYVEEYFSRLNVVMTAGKPQCDLLYISPVESVWCKVYSGVFDALIPTDDEIKNLEKIYQDTFMVLAENGIDFDYGDEEMLSRLANINDGFNVGEMKYKKVLITGMSTIRRTTLKLLEEFIQKGGEVIVAGDKPKYIDAKEADFNLNAIYIDRNDIAKYCLSGNEIVTGNKNIFNQVRITDTGKNIICLNISKEEQSNVTLNLGTGSYVQELNAKNGEVLHVDFETINGDIVVNTDFCSGEEKIYTLFNSGSPALEKQSEIKPTKEIKLTNSCNYTLSEPNVLVLDMVEYKGEVYEVLKADMKIRDEYNIPYRGGKMMQPWFCGNDNEILGEVTLKYSFNIDIMPKNDLELVLEHPKDFEILVNNKEFDLSNTNGMWIDICFDKFTLPVSMLNVGVNEICLTTKFHKTNDLEAIYILGDFGVKLDGNTKTIIDLPKIINIGDISTQGLPFYSGNITYHFDIAVTQLSSLKLNVGGALSKVNGEIVAYEPYIAYVQPCDKLDVEVLLTRRNTFGPLHLLPKVIRFYGPPEFVSTGEHYTDDYVIFEQGILNI